jgi:beta-lactamase regulating signal transducer with metallopeptidase domain
MIERSLFEYLVNSLWQLPLLAAATWLLIRLARPSLFIQHTLWFATLLLAVLIPLRGIEWTPPTQEPTCIGCATLAQPGWDEPPQLPALALKPPSLSDRIQSLLTLRTQPMHLEARTMDWLIELYGVSFAFALARLVHGYVAARALVASASAHPLTTLESTLLKACADRLHLPTDRIPELRFLTNPSASPMVIDLRRPVLLLPESLRQSGASFDANALTAILSHELAHVRRRDYLANLLARAAALPIAYHPATIALHRRIRQTREMICDAHAAGSFDCASTYARSLLSLAQRLVEPPHHNVEAVGLFDHTRNSLEERIMNLTEPIRTAGRSLRIARIAAGSIILASAAGAASTLHVKAAAPILVVQAEAPAQTPDQTPQAAPASAPAPQAAPAPKPAPAPVAHDAPTAPTAPTAAERQHARIVVDGNVRDLTPEEQAQLDKDLAESRVQIHDMMVKLKELKIAPIVVPELKIVQSPEFKKQMADIHVDLNSPGFRKSMDDVKVQLNDPAFKKQIAEAARISSEAALKSEHFKEQMAELKLQMDGPEFRKQIEEAKRLSIEANADSARQLEEVRKQLDAAKQAVEEAQKTAHDQATQQRLEEAQRRLHQATQNAQPR